MNRSHRQSFTMVEVLAALVLLAIVVPVVVRCVQVAGRVGVVAERAETAAQLGDSYLQELVTTDSWQASDERGDFGDDWPGYHWQFKTEDWDDEAAFKLLTIEVFYPVQGHEYSVQLSTLAPVTTEAQ